MQTALQEEVMRNEEDVLDMANLFEYFSVIAFLRRLPKRPMPNY